MSYSSLVKEMQKRSMNKTFVMNDKDIPGKIVTNNGTDLEVNYEYARKGCLGGMLTADAILHELDSGHIKIDPFNKSMINPNSYNVRLHPELKIYTGDVLDSRKYNKTKKLMIPEEGLILQPGELYLGRTVERTWTDDYIMEIDGRSSYGRLGMYVHVTAGFGDLGFDGTWTLEIQVIKPLKIYPYDEVAQVCFFTKCGKGNVKYDGRYQGQVDATESRVQMKKKEYKL